MHTGESTSLKDKSGRVHTRVLIIGNAGSGKTTLARRLAGGTAAVLSMDAVAWGEGTQRMPLADALRALDAFRAQHPSWIIEGCYADIAEPLLPHCTELIFLNPGIDACVAHCRARPWEPDKFASPDAQRAHVEALVAWVRDYERRDDEFGLRRHRALFDAFTGPKQELTKPDAYR